MQGSSSEPVALERGTITTLQMHLGRPAGGTPATDAAVARVCRRTAEVMGASASVETLEIAGLGAGLERCLRDLVAAGRRLHRRIVLSTSAAELLTQASPDLPCFLAEHGVEVHAVISSVPVGRGESPCVAALRVLNAAGFGRPDSGLVLILSLGGQVTGAADGDALEDECRRELRRCHGIEFTRLQRVGGLRRRSGALHQYGAALQRWCNPVAVSPLACLSSLTVRWDGRLFDCAFNQALGLELRGPRRRPLTIFDLRRVEELSHLPVSTAPHCFGCTAGMHPGFPALSLGAHAV